MTHSNPYHCVSAGHHVDLLRSSHGHRTFTDADEEGNKLLKCVNESRSIFKVSNVMRQSSEIVIVIHRTIVLSLRAQSGYNDLPVIICRL
jgi:hypothetical protein